MKYIKKYKDYLIIENQIPIKKENQILSLSKEDRNDYFTTRLNNFISNKGTAFLDYELDLCPKKIRIEYIKTCINYGYGIYTENYSILNPTQLKMYIISRDILNHTGLENYQFNPLSDELKSFYIKRVIEYNLYSKNYISLSENQFDSCPENILKEFFPSLYNLDGDKELQFKNKNILPKKYQYNLTQNLYNITNKLAILILIDDLDNSNLCIKKGKIVKIDKNEIVFSFKSTYEVENIKQTLDLWKYRKKYSISYIENELEGFDYTHILNKIFKEYYEKNKDGIILQNIGEISYETFEQNYNETFFEDSYDIISGIKSTIVSKTSDEYDEECQKEIDAITKYINIDEINNKCNSFLSKKYFIEFILENNIEEIDNVNLFVIEYIERYCDNTDDTTIYTSLKTDVSYTDNDIKYVVDSFFENKFNEIELTPEQKEAYNKCNNILNKFFINNIFENNFIYIKYNYYDMEQMLVNVSVTFKKTNKKYKGYINVDQLVNYITHEDLFD